jgi:prepilin-type N-terminal cleavage/methylation domain-containing protein
MRTQVAGCTIMKRYGFSIIEVLIAILLVGLAIASLIIASGSFTKANSAATDLSTAEFLIEQIRERSISAKYSDLRNLEHFDGVIFSPPISANGESLDNFVAFSEQIIVVNVRESNFEEVVAYDSGFIRVTVKVFLNSKEISSASWLRANIDN